MSEVSIDLVPVSTGTTDYHSVSSALHLYGCWYMFHSMFVDWRTVRSLFQLLSRQEDSS